MHGMMGDEALRNQRQQLSPERLERAREAIVFLSNLPIITGSASGLQNGKNYPTWLYDGV